MQKPIRFPKAKTWDKLFHSATPADGAAPTIEQVTSWDSGTRKGRRATPWTKLSAHCSVDRAGAYEFIHAFPTMLVIDFFKSGNVLHCSYDTMTFNVVIHDDGRALVILQHGQIIGSHWLAFIDAATVPTFKTEEAGK